MILGHLSMIFSAKWQNFCVGDIRLNSMVGIIIFIICLVVINVASFHLAAYLAREKPIKIIEAETGAEVTVGDPTDLLGHKVSEVAENIKKKQTVKCDYIGIESAGLRSAYKYDFFCRKKYGYLNADASKVVIDFQYDDASSFCNGLAAVKKDGKWGYIDTEGNVVIDFLFDEADYFHDEQAEVSIAYETFIIDKEGTIVGYKGGN